MGKFIISYRRSDSENTAGRLADGLMRSFGDDAVFFDTQGAPGDGGGAAPQDSGDPGAGRGREVTCPRTTAR